ncbi:MAG: erythromycin esterase family protein [Verrucomicrobia bacterium]|nr:erythromycin esterase family protein [Verrucomicrobiota bacterium]
MRTFVSFAPGPAETVRAAARPLADDDVQPVLDEIGDASLVLMGEATHGTHEFYALRARVTRALIAERGFSAVAIEGDWPEAYQVNRYVRGEGGASVGGAVEALAGFARFPTWMWGNTAVAGFVRWLHAYNATLHDPGARVGFYGLDLYSLHASMRAVVDYLEQHDPEAASQARRSYACFDAFGNNTDTYAWATGRLGNGTCEDAVVRELLALRGRRSDFLRRAGDEASDEFFYAEQNARLAQNAERYYRTMFQGQVASWNVRDRHMAETLEALREHLRSRGQAEKIVVWAHNSHLGDARATEMGEVGELNLGQMVRERHGPACKLIGQTTYSGTAIAASDWGRPGERKQVRPALTGSIEALFHQTGLPRFLLPLGAGTDVHALLTERRLERAIGVIYRPETERRSHYFHARLAAQFDAVIHQDATQAVEPLEPIDVKEDSELPETYPSGV